MSYEAIKKIVEQRKVAWEATKALLDSAETEGRDLTAEDETVYQRHMADIDGLDKRRKRLEDVEQRKADEADAIAEVRDTPVDSSKVPVKQGAGEQLRKMFTTGGKLTVRSGQPMGTQEFRDLSKLTAGAGANTVPTSFYNRLMAHLIEVSGIMNAGPTVLNTNTGEQIQVPKTTSHSTAVLTAEAAAIAESDPVFGQVPLDAYKYALLLQVSSELTTDTGVDLEGYVAMQAGRAVGNAFGAHAITGTGTNQPNGLSTAATTGVTGGAGVGGAFTFDNLIDLYFSVIAPYRNSPSCAWLMRDSSLGTARKLKDTNGSYLWAPAASVGAPDTILSKPAYTDPNVAAVALSARSVLFGDISQYFVRMVNGIDFAVSEHFAFNSDLITYRVKLRADGDLVDVTGAVKAFVGNAA